MDKMEMMGGRILGSGRRRYDTQTSLNQTEVPRRKR